MDDQPGGLSGMLKILEQANVDIEYLYACIGKATDKALVVMKPSDVEAAEKALKEKGYNGAPSDIYRI